MPELLTPASSAASLSVPVYPKHIDEIGRARAGYALKLIDICAALPPTKHMGSGSMVVTASLDRTDFMNPVRRWDILTLQGRLTQTWNTSMESQVTLSTWNLRTQETIPVATAYLVYVALDPSQKPIAVPKLVLQTDEDRQLAAAADLRKQNRLQEGKYAPLIAIEPEIDQPVSVDAVMGLDEANSFHKVFGGVILDLVHQAGRKAAEQQNLGNLVANVRQDRMNFLEPTFIGEVISARAVVTKTWFSSMEVQVEVEAINPTSGLRRLIGHSYLTFVGLDPEEKPSQVPPWVPRTEKQEARAAAADLRRKNREQEARQVLHP